MSELEQIKNIHHLPLLTAKDWLEDISNHIEKRLATLQSQLKETHDE